MTRKEIIESRYELREQRKFGNYTLRVFAHKGMGNLPSKLVSHYSDYWHYCGTGWYRSNPDFGRYDVTAVVQRTAKCCNVYVCGILVRPFTEGERLKYESECLKFQGVTDRLMAFFDNRV